MATPETYLTLGQAAKECGKGKGTLSKAIKSGKLSVAAKEGNSYKIDPAELFRVYPKQITETPETVEYEQKETPDDSLETLKLKMELNHVKELLEREEKAHQETKDEKKRLLDTLGNQTRLLEHKQETIDDVLETVKEKKKGFWSFFTS